MERTKPEISSSAGLQYHIFTDYVNDIVDVVSEYVVIVIQSSGNNGITITCFSYIYVRQNRKFSFFFLFFSFQIIQKDSGA